MERRADFRPFSWFNDLHQRKQLDLDPPYQRRSVWSPQYRLDFVTTVLMGYPCPAIFLFEEIKPDGSFLYKVVDGKQRLTTLFDFVQDKFTVDEKAELPCSGQYFKDLDDTTKLSVWRYIFGVEFIQQENLQIINDIFNRINKNVAKLSPQELRHAMFNGEFISAVEELTEQLERKLPTGFPRIAPQSKRQMKDVENIALLFVFLEQGERSMSQAALDGHFAERDEGWETKDDCIGEFTAAIEYIRKLLDENGAIAGSRLRNQAEFYSLFAAVVELGRTNGLPPAAAAAASLGAWLESLNMPQEELPENDQAYLAAARAASNDPGPRRRRIERVKEVLTG